MIPCMLGLVILKSDLELQGPKRLHLRIGENSENVSITGRSGSEHVQVRLHLLLVCHLAASFVVE